MKAGWDLTPGPFGQELEREGERERGGCEREGARKRERESDLIVGLPHVRVRVLDSFEQLAHLQRFQARTLEVLSPEMQEMQCKRL